MASPNLSEFSGRSFMLKKVTPTPAKKMSTPPDTRKAMTKRALAVAVAEFTDLPLKDVQRVIQHSLDLIIETLVEGETVEFRNFGVFETVKRDSRAGRNPNAPDETIIIPARRIVKFKPGKLMRESVAKT